MNNGNLVSITQSRWLHRSMKALRGSVILLSMLLLIGCVSPAAYREPIARFQMASTVVIEGARTYYGVANKSEREAEIDRRVARKEEITLRVLNDTDLRLFGPDDLAARMAVLDASAKHCQLLLALASSDAPTKAKDAANSLDDAIEGLKTSLGKGKDVSNEEFKRTAEGFTIIAGEAAKLALEIKISKALDKAIAASEEHVKALIRLLRTEMGALYERRRNQLSANRVRATDDYRDELMKEDRSDSKLLKAAARIKEAEDAWDTLPLMLGAGPGLDAMAQAHQKLVDYAKGPKKPQDLADLVEAIDAFVTRAKVIAEAIKTLQEAKE